MSNFRFPLVHSVLWWSGVSSRVYSHFVPKILGIGSRSTATLTRIKLKINKFTKDEWINFIGYFQLDKIWAYTLSGLFSVADLLVQYSYHFAWWSEVTCLSVSTIHWENYRVRRSFLSSWLYEDFQISYAIQTNSTLALKIQHWS